jgi:putative ABC transport system permease protein
VRRLIGADAACIIGAGIVIGLAGGWVLARGLRGFLFGVGTLDPVTFLAVPVLLAAVALGALLPPAERAARTDPLIALRAD